MKITRHEEEVTDSLISHERRMLVVEKSSGDVHGSLSTGSRGVDAYVERSTDGLKSQLVSIIIHSFTFISFMFNYLSFFALPYPTLTYHDTHYRPSLLSCIQSILFNFIYLNNLPIKNHF